MTRRTFVVGQQLTSQDAFYINSELDKIETLLAEIADSAAREADFRNRAEVAEAKLAQFHSMWKPGVYTVHEPNPEDIGTQVWHGPLMRFGKQP